MTALFKIIFVLCCLLPHSFANDLFSGIETTGGQINAPVTELTAYIHRSQISVSRGMATVRQRFSNLRIGPSTDYSIMNVAKSGDQFRVLSQADSWYKIVLPETFDRAVQPARMHIAHVTARSGLNLRQSPNGRILRTLRNGTRVEVLSREGNWTRVNANGTEGYLYSSYLEFDAGSYQDISGRETDVLDTDSTPPSATTPSEAVGGAVARLDGGGYEIRSVPEYAQRGRDSHSPDGNSWRPQAYCGPTSFQMVMSYWGVNRSRDYWALTHPRTGEEIRSSTARGQIYIRGAGASYQPMVEMAKRSGFANSSIVWNSSIQSLRTAVSQGRPQIVSVQGRISYQNGRSYNTNGHVMVVVGVQGDGDVIINDPATGRRGVMSSSNFRRIWRGFSVDIKR